MNKKISIPLGILIILLVIAVIVGVAFWLCPRASKGWQQSNRIITDNGNIVVEKGVYNNDDRAVFMNLHIDNSGITLLSNPELVAGGYPNYLPGGYKFMARILSFKGAVVGEYGFNDPRIILAEQGYQGPTWLDSTDFNLIIPYLEDAYKINIYSSTELMLSIDISDLVNK